MCEKCNYQIRETLKELLNDNPDECFIQIGLNSEDSYSRKTTNFLIRAINTGMTINAIIFRLEKGLRGNVEAGGRRAYQEALNALDKSPKITPQEAQLVPQATIEPGNDEWGGLWD
jgi:hypothetical protein